MDTISRTHLRNRFRSSGLELAIKHKTHVDTLLAARQAYLANIGREETDKKFRQYADEVPIDLATIATKIQQEMEKEASRGTAYVSPTGIVTLNPKEFVEVGGMDCISLRTHAYTNAQGEKLAIKQTPRLFL